MATSLSQLRSVVTGRPDASLALASLCAYERLQGGVLLTPLLPSAHLAAASGAASVMLKMESEQYTGSFKCRGAVNKLSTLSPEQLARGVVTSSTGNHALAVMHAWRHVCERHQHNPALAPASTWPAPQVFVASNAAPHKVNKIKAAGGSLVVVGEDCVEAETAACQHAQQSGLVYVSPYNDLEVMAGQGTIGVELLLQYGKAAQAAGQAAAGPQVVLVPVGGGGLISGIASVLKAWDPSIQVIGCQPAASAVMSLSVAAGHIVEQQAGSTLSDATAGGVEPGALTLAPCRALVDDWVLLDEEEIADAMLLMLQKQGKLVEGAAGVALAAVTKLKDRLAGLRVAVIVCGGNVALDTLSQLLQRHKA